MKTGQVNIDFTVMAKAMREHVRNKAATAGSTIVYKKNGILIEENPRNSKKVIIKNSST